MQYFIPFTVGFLAAFLGLLAPAMLNMTAAKISIEKNKKSGIEFSLGAIVVVFIQAYIAVAFAKPLVNNPSIIAKLKIAAVFILSGLAFFFFIKAKQQFKTSSKKQRFGSFLSGISLSALNMLAVPFYLAMATLAESKQWIQLKSPDTILYVSGATLGSFTIFASYVFLANNIAKRIQFIATNINYVLSGLFLVLALITSYQVIIV